jgi:hypothetical protein
MENSMAFENHQEKVIQEMHERFRIYKKKKGSEKNGHKFG